MTPIQLCRAIDSDILNLPYGEQEDLRRIYEKTWNIVVLCRDGLAKPTKNAVPRLSSLYQCIEAANAAYGTAVVR